MKVSKHKGKRFLAPILAAIVALAIAFIFSCSSDLEMPKPPDTGWFSSSSGEQSGISSSSSVSSSSNEGGSSSSSVIIGEGLCEGFIEGTIRENHYGKNKPQFCDPRNGKRYVYVEIGTQIWMAENLNYYVSGSKCGDGFQGSTLSDEDNANCDKYGRLYDWATAMDIDTKYNSELWNGSDVKHQGVCPSGWHLPSGAELDVLLKYADPSFVSDYVNIAGTKLKTESDWSFSSSSGNGEDAHGFSALPGGVGYPNNAYSDVNVCGFWWGTTEAIEFNVSYAYHLNMIILEYAFFYQAQKYRLESVRCVKND